MGGLESFQSHNPQIGLFNTGTASQGRAARTKALHNSSSSVECVFQIVNGIGPSQYRQELMNCFANIAVFAENVHKNGLNRV